MIQVRTVYDAIFSDMAGCSSDVLSVSQPTVAGVIQAAEKKYGKKFTEAVIDDSGKLIPAVSVLVDGHRLGVLDDRVNDGDEVAFLVPIAGG